ncbi:MAG TPA: hybrid sensor histidine kinase/response regulator [Marinilabiliales bacterium]|nr:MAG: hybrid sensor histidine kinase/response regulator [Bacteroidetes bacterium GWA2_40_14]OFX64696.1 MAG: hybrid sensor histidine kinase/response regulator [Bacteroidetes bacterium GWC2_40_13]OFX73626.1 MAG: hybrid sensor histidine kinase/response regulator [Bacteroidetes bacterium GWD2_40_43]OFX88486.1 MAG: hybrid sensor histidine kinase/response regulator [Bacteroidetes bacterium GWE2_40_63]OFY22644.1 MAG: hybrid sensor histidine kinase/response regulator [Bacteroidetes bacterium GWF2_40_
MRQFNRFFYTLILIIAGYFHTIALPSYNFHHLKTENGLSNNSVKTFLKDSYGFLWIGTESGLNRYDGYGFKVYSSQPEMPNSLTSNDIMGLNEDGLGNIWINLGFSYLIYHREKDCFISDVQNYLKDLRIPVGQNIKVYVDKKQDFWVISGQKAFVYNSHSKTYTGYEIKTQIDDVTAISLSDDGQRLFAVQKSGLLWSIDKSNGNQELIEFPAYLKKEINNLFNKVYVDSYNGLWVFTNIPDWIYYKKGPDSEWRKMILSSSIKAKSNIISSITDDGNGHIWIGTDHEGLFIYDRDNDTFTNLLHNPWTNSTIASNNVGCLYRDSSGVIWIGHSKKGISFYHESFQNFINIEHPDCKDVNTILEDQQGNVWLGTDGNGLYQDKKSGNNIRKLPIPNYAIVSLLEDQKGGIWAGTYLNGLFYYKDGVFSNYTKNNSNLTNDNIWSLAEDRYGNLWICSLGGGIQCLPADNKNLDSPIITINEIGFTYDMFYDGGDKLYVGTAYGLCTIDIITRSKVMYYGNKKETQKFKQMFVFTTYKDGNDCVWLGHNQGLTLWDLKNDTLYYLDKKNGLCDNIIRDIISDNYGNTWVTTSNGLSVLTVNRGAQGILRISIKNFFTKDGLKDNYFNGHAIYKRRNGDILLGGTEGYTIANPNKMAEKNQPISKVVFTGLGVGNKSIQIDSIYNGNKLLGRPMEQTNSLVFSNKDKLISLQFTTCDLLNADKVKYAYKVKGFNDQWLPAQGNKIEFSSLNPGSYKLQIKACNSDGVWNEEATVLDITVKPPLYLSWWAYVSYYILIAALVLFFIYRFKKQHYIRIERQRIQLEHEKEANLNEMKLRFFTNISHDLRTPLTLIITPLQTILNGSLEEGLRKKLNIAHKNAEQLLQLINSLLDFRKLDVGAESLRPQTGDMVSFIDETCAPFLSYATERGIKFTFSHQTESLSMHFDPYKVQRILSNLFSNAFKYTPDGGKIDVNIYQSKDSVFISISDTGPGISESEKYHVFERFYQSPQKQEKTGSGIGLHIASEYAIMHGGSINVTDNEPHGCIFTIKLPIQETDIAEKLITEYIKDEEMLEEPDTPDIPANPVLLFVDDNKEFCEFMADSLSDEYTLLIAYNGQEALELLHDNDVNIVISDVMMPIMNGTELCNRIKTDIHLSHIPVILLTARTAEEYKIEGLELGADDYITKPFNFNLLKLRIRKFLEWREKCHLSFSQKMDVSPSEITITSLDEQLIEKAIKVTEENIENPEFSVEELSSAVGLSRSHLYKKLMHITGKGPLEFIRTIRLKRGRQLLEKSQLQIAEVAYSVGYSSPKRFTINFKHEFGISPSEYLRSLNNGK